MLDYAENTFNFLAFFGLVWEGGRNEDFLLDASVFGDLNEF